MKELTEEETKISRKTRELLSSLDEKEKDLTEYQTTFMFLYGGDMALIQQLLLQTFQCW
jgi:hypothetical protein